MKGIVTEKFAYLLLNVRDKGNYYIVNYDDGNKLSLYTKSSLGILNFDIIEETN